MEFSVLAEKLDRAGFFQYGLIPVSKIVLHDNVRVICKENMCRHYGTTWACPPAVGSLEQCREKLGLYSSAMLFSARYELEDSFDYPGMMSAHADFKTLCDSLYWLVKPHLESFLILSNESCIRCEKCTYPEKPCLFPEMLFPSLEGFGVNVSELVALAGMSYASGEDMVTYFGMLLL